MRYSKKLLSLGSEFKISKRSIKLLKQNGINSIFFHGNHKKGYAVVGRNHEKLHRVLMRLSGYNTNGLEVDHKNGNKLDNRLFNLRIATSSQNKFNRLKNKNNKSGFKGVCFRNGKWIAQIGRIPTTIHLGVFPTKELAAKAYNAAAIKRYGKFAKLNIIPK